jgi:hypothetical protein
MTCRPALRQGKPFGSRSPIVRIDPFDPFDPFEPFGPWDPFEPDPFEGDGVASGMGETAVRPSSMNVAGPLLESSGRSFHG